jgi:hypothetical protein
VVEELAIERAPPVQLFLANATPLGRRLTRPFFAMMQPGDTFGGQILLQVDI